MEHTKIKVVAGQEYICLMTNDIKEGDLIVKSLFSIDRPIEHTLNKVTFANKKANVFRYDKVSGDGNHSFGIDVFRSMTDISKYMGRKCSMELDILHAKVVGKLFYNVECMISWGVRGTN